LPVARLNRKVAAVAVKTETEIKRSRIIWIVLIALAVIALIVAFLLDHATANWIAAHSSPHLKHVMQIVSRVGDWPAHLITGAIGIGIAFAAKSKVWVRIFLAMMIALALAGVTGRVIKLATGRARPSVTSETHWNGPRLSSKYHAFPSGHTASSTAFFVALFLARKKIGAPLLLIPILIALSRMIVGAHYLSDVTFATILGVICALLVAHWLSIRNPRFAIESGDSIDH
jgi:membrane-associated phospholipid phosphatase